MEMTLEAIIAIVSLVVGLPSTIFVLWKCSAHRRRASRRTLRRSSASFDSMPHGESSPQHMRYPTFRHWTLVGFEFDMPNQTWHDICHLQPMRGNTPGYSFLNVRDGRESLPIWNQMRSGS
ncbi:hypothetical protein LX32DRAFT_165969 [Colletotrichum zoysiae]|uniref:Uncharacterized protein n=1 Tax=Colletotrichum zoysiae TaxID=1216348 RepID=A0AAD9LW99_9PEZI|nr:hypothetical protein LX32DRAFT_165969 [Colletotrichum zoysiae]